MENKRFGFFTGIFGKKDTVVEIPKQENVSTHTELEGDGSTIQAVNYEAGIPDVQRTVSNHTPSMFDNRDRTQKIKMYRKMAKSNEVSRSIEDIVNECIVTENREKIIQLNLDETDIKDAKKKLVQEEFDNILRMLNFKTRGQDYFMDWYIDGEIYFEICINKDKPKEGIRRFNKIDPLKMTKIKKVYSQKDTTGNSVIKGIKKMYLYQPMIHGTKKRARNYEGTATKNVLFQEHNLLYSSSGLIDHDNDIVVSYLDKAIRPYNQLKLMEDALVIYRLARAPERRIFYIDVGGMPKSKAEGYMQRVMQTYKNKITYDGDTGTLKDTTNQMMMQDDFWLPRADGKGTEVSNLAGAANLGDIEDVEYFRNNLNESLHVPLSRLEPDSGNVLGRATEISRDELNFNKFAERLKNKFSEVFIQALRVQLILKGITTSDEWETIKEDIAFVYNRDSYFTELKKSEIMRERISLLNDMVEYRGSYFSNSYIRKEVLYQTDEDIEAIDKEIQEEMKDDQYKKPLGNEEPFDDSQFENGSGFGGPSEVEEPETPEETSKKDEDKEDTKEEPSKEKEDKP